MEHRCGSCNRLLAKGEALNLAIKCPRCGAINHLRAVSPIVERRRAPKGTRR
ncbi:Com family DNA-binding transcriptional regulator [Desulfarculus baarsii]